jgi:hypothetical protein
MATNGDPCSCAEHYPKAAEADTGPDRGTLTYLQTEMQLNVSAVRKRNTTVLILLALEQQSKRSERQLLSEERKQV